MKASQRLEVLDGHVHQVKIYQPREPRDDRYRRMASISSDGEAPNTWEMVIERGFKVPNPQGFQSTTRIF